MGQKQDGSSQAHRRPQVERSVNNSREGATTSPEQELEPTQRTVCVVLGMHRSGTSALARTFNLAGCDLPKTLMKGGNGNEPGHWESQAIADFNDELLAAAGSHWDDWLAIEATWYQSQRAAGLAARARSLIAEEADGSRCLVLKDPRICRILPFWLDVFSKMRFEPVFVVPVRNPLEVARSLQARDGFEQSLGLLLWLRHVLAAEADSRNFRRFFCSYDALLTDWAGLLSKAQKALGISFPKPAEAPDAEIDAFLSESQRHHHEPPDRVIDNPAVSIWVRKTYEILHNWAEQGESQQDCLLLDQLRVEFDTACPAFASLVSDGRRMAVMQNQTDEMGQRLQDAHDRLAVCSDDIAALKTDQLEKQSVIDGLGEQIAWMQQVLTATLDGRDGYCGRLTAPSTGTSSRNGFLHFLKQKRLFDADAYLRAHPDVAKVGSDPFDHYIKHGIKEGRRRK